MTDLIYIKDKMFTKFIANTAEGEYVWREIAAQMCSDVAAVLNVDAKRVIAQIRAAGYTVRKAPKCDMSIDEIYNELNN